MGTHSTHYGMSFSLLLRERLIVNTNHVNAYRWITHELQDWEDASILAKLKNRSRSLIFFAYFGISCCELGNV